MRSHAAVAALAALIAGWSGSAIYSIDNNGTMVGVAYNIITGVERGFALLPRLDPVPEPATVLLLAAGIGAAVSRRFQARRAG